MNIRTAINDIENAIALLELYGHGGEVTRHAIKNLEEVIKFLKERDK